MQTWAGEGSKGNSGWVEEANEKSLGLVGPGKNQKPRAEGLGNPAEKGRGGNREPLPREAGLRRAETVRSSGRRGTGREPHLDRRGPRS